MKIDFLLVRSVRTPLAIETALLQRACIQKHFPSYWELFSFQDDYFDMPPVSVKHRLLFKADRKLQSKHNETQSQLSQVRNTTHLWLHKIERILSTLWFARFYNTYILKNVIFVKTDVSDLLSLKTLVFWKIQIFARAREQNPIFYRSAKKL